MCPERERTERCNQRFIHKLEALEGFSQVQFYRNSMIKKFQRSSADHVLQIAEMLRTPSTLLRTITYIEDVIMNKAEDGYDPQHGDVTAKVFVYLFIWDRYRMIAKDFILQITALPVTDIWVECHERMARWMIYMDHYMRTEGETVFEVYLYCMNLLLTCCDNN